jgi:L-histidine N-alpha-methyltransferase
MYRFTLIPSGSNNTLRKNGTFYTDVIRGLSHTPKYLESKYFYDIVGDHIFQRIMDLPEYYLTGCEREILSGQAADIIQTLHDYAGNFDLVELGAGDATKTEFLLRQLLKEKVDFTYFPIDISTNVIRSLDEELGGRIPGLQWHGLNGEYMEMLRESAALSSKKKVVLFMGANIGNFPLEEARSFCQALRDHLQAGDLLFIGFDLKKDPQVILDAYNDSQGVTRDFNLNLLSRINKELGADFLLSDFRHFPTYDPLTGSCKSYLVSLKQQWIHIGGTPIHFDAYEPIYMEVSQKYSLDEIHEMGRSTGFEPIADFRDKRRWFTDCLWRVK